MAVRDYFRGLWSAVRGRQTESGAGGGVLARPSLQDGTSGRWATSVQKYDVVDAYRYSSDLYGRMSTELQIRGYSGYQNIRNPANRQIEFYVTKLTDGLLENLKVEPGGPNDTEQPDIEADELPSPPEQGTDQEGLAEEVLEVSPEIIKGLIAQMWEWSNWEDKVEVAARNFPTHGDVFVKIENSEDMTRVQFNLLDPRVVQDDFQVDARGFFTYLRLDIPQEERDPTEPDEVIEYTRTEIWDKQAGQYLVYHHDEDPGVDLADLDPGDLVFSALLTSEPPASRANWTGYDFIPVVHRKLKDTGEPRGEGSFEHALDGIDAANWIATRLFAMLFPKVTWKGTRQPGPGGTSLGPFRVETEESDDETISRLTNTEQEAFRVVEVSGERTILLPGGADMEALVPNINFDAHLAALEAQLKELEKDMPELAYYRLRDMGEISGRAVLMLLGDVIDRLGRARHKFEDLHVRMHKMGMTIGKVTNVEGFEVIPDGAYDLGLLDHTFEEYQLFPVSKVESLEADEIEGRVLAAFKALGPELFARKLSETDLGFTLEQARAIAASVQAVETRQSIASLVNTRTPTGNGAGTATPRDTDGG